MALILGAAAAKADLLATFETSRGNITASLEYETAPKAVANFIGLAEGTRPWIDDEAGGVLRMRRYYDGNVIHRGDNSANFKFAQGGSRVGDGSDGPGYVFKDEFSPDQLHTPYVLSMANAGPHTNGGQFFFTGSLPQPSFNFVHTVFGRITEPASRAVVDQMITAGPGGTTIHRVTFDRTDPAALAFDEHAQALPVCAGSKGRLHVIRGVESVWKLDQAQPPGSVIRAYGSTNLSSWIDIFRLYQGSEGPTYSAFRFDNATRPKAFYQIPLVTYPNHLSPTSLADFALLVTWSGTQFFYFEFDESGNGGLGVFSGNPNLITPILDVRYVAEGYSATIIIETVHYNTLRIRAGFDRKAQGMLLGTHTVEQEFAASLWMPVGRGDLELTPIQ